MEVLLALMFLPIMVLIFIFVQKIIQKWFMDDVELTDQIITQAEESGDARAIPESFARSKRSGEDRINAWVERTSSWIRSWSTNYRAWAPEENTAFTQQDHTDSKEMERKLKWMQSEYDRLEAALELKSKMINERTQQIDEAEKDINNDLTAKKQEVEKLNQELTTRRSQQQILLEEEMKIQREIMLNDLYAQIEKERYELRKSLADDVKTDSETSNEFINELDNKLQSELENIGRVFTGLANEKMYFSEKDLQILLQNSYFNIMSSTLSA